MDRNDLRNHLTGGGFSEEQARTLLYTSEKMTEHLATQKALDERPTRKDLELAKAEISSNVNSNVRKWIAAAVAFLGILMTILQVFG